jgi:HemY protein
LTAQAAEIAGDTRKAEETYKKLIQNDATRFVGVRGIMKQKLAAGDTETARKLAEKAFELKPKDAETQDILLNLQAQAKDWTGARATLNAKLKSGGLPRDVYTRRQAVLALAEAGTLFEKSEDSAAHEKALEANRLSPGLVPAAAMAAKSLIAKGNARNAVRVLKKAWDTQPHPDLAAAFAAIAPDESPAERLKRFQTLLTSHKEHAETKLVLAELNIVAENFPEARRVLNSLVEGDGDARAFTLMAVAEKGAGADDNVVHGWLTRALSAPRAPQWVCDVCGDVQATWTAVCTNCGSFDTLSWTSPKQSELVTSTGAEMLPFVGAAASKDQAQPEEDTSELIEAKAVETEKAATA